MTAPLKICLIMHSTRSDNLGVGALTVAEVDLLRRLADKAGRELKICVVDFKDSRDPYVQGDDIQIFDMDRDFLIRRSGFFALVRACDMVIDIGAGDSFADIYGAGRLKRMLFMKFMTHLAGTPLVLAPQTIGPFTKSWSRFLALKSIRRSAIVATRDTLSTKALRGMGYSGDAIEASDIALRLPYDKPAPREAGAPKRIGLNVSGLLLLGGYSGKNDLGLKCDYPTLMRNLITTFLEKHQDTEVHLVPHVIVHSGPMQQEDDLRASQALAREFPEVKLAPEFRSPMEAKSYIAGLDFFAGARMHACIAAFSSGVPVVPMAYSRKFAGLFGSLGYNHTLDCTQIDTAAAHDMVMSLYASREALAEEARTAFALGLEKLEVYDERVLALMERSRP